MNALNFLFGDGIEKRNIRINTAYINHGHKINLVATISYFYEDEIFEKEISFSRNKI